MIWILLIALVAAACGYVWYVRQDDLRFPELAERRAQKAKRRLLKREQERAEVLEGIRRRGHFP